MGSRGSMTFSAPPSTRTAPYAAEPMQRSLTPSAPSPSYGAPGIGAPGYRAPGFGSPAYGNRSPFMSGLMGGLIGAGIGGMLFGHGMFGGIDGIGSLFGLLLQIALVVFLVRMAFRLFTRQPAFAGSGMFARMNQGMASGGGGPRPVPGGGRPSPSAVTITPGDYQEFERTLKEVQASWTAHDLPRMQALATPEMVSYFAEQMSDQASRGVRNSVTDVRLDSGDLSQSWAEQGREYATVAMRFSMIDVTVDTTGRVVDGSANERSTATEIWTFVRAPRGRWLLSAIQQTR